MARIPEEEIERLKSEVSIERLAESAGVTLKRHGADLLGLCPFHDDHEPSLVISTAKNLWHCLGACNTGGSVIDWVMKANGVSFRHAVELLKADLPLVATPAAPVKRSSVRHLDAPFSPDADDHAAQELAEKLTGEGLDCYRIEFPKGMDANAYALQVQPAVKSLGLVIRSAVWVGDVQGSTSVAGGRKPGATKGPKKPTTKAPTSTSETVQEAPPLEQIIESCPAVDDDPIPSLVAKEEPQNETDSLPAQRIPSAPKEIPAEVSEEEIALSFGDRRYRVRGLARNLSYEVLKVNLLASREAPEELGALLHVDTFDLYSARHRAAFIKQAGLELGVKEEVIKRDLGAVLLKLEALQEERIKEAQAPKETELSLSEEEEAEALALLKSPDLMQRILDDFHTAGVVGEETNKLVGYLAAVSRKLDKPLAVIIQSTSAAGKSSLMDAVLNMIPEEERVQYSAMTGQSLFYMGETNLKNKILAIAEEEGAENASYALKLLQSEGVLTIASTGKDESTGSLVTKQYRVEGPVMLFLTTTAIDIDEELMNRCLVLTVNESREQTQAIHAMQRRQQTLEGLLQNEDKKHQVQLHRNAQRLLRPLLVANPFAERLTFIDDKTRTRRDHMKYLTLIRAIALLHQYQREVKRVNHQGQRLEYIEVALSDIETANRLAHEVLGRTLEELPPQTCTLLKHIKSMVSEACKQQGIAQEHYRFSRRDVRTYSGWSDFQVKKHMTRLQELEYVLIHRGGRGQSFVYELLYDGELNDDKHLMGLIDVENLHYDKKKEPPKADKEPSSSPQVAAKAPPGSTSENGEKTGKNRVSGEVEEKEGEKTYIGGNNSSPSYRTSDLHVLAAKGRA